MIGFCFRILRSVRAVCLGIHEGGKCLDTAFSLPLACMGMFSCTTYIFFTLLCAIVRLLIESGKALDAASVWTDLTAAALYITGLQDLYAPLVIHLH